MVLSAEEFAAQFPGDDLADRNTAPWQREDEWQMATVLVQRLGQQVCGGGAISKGQLDVHDCSLVRCGLPALMQVNLGQNGRSQRSSALR